MPSTSSTATRGSAVSHALARNRIGAFGVSMSIASSVAPLTVVAGVVTTALAVTGLRGVPIAMLAVAAVLLVFTVGYMAMARHITNAGAFYAYVARGIDRRVGVGASWVALVAYISFQIAAYGGVGAIGAPLIEEWFGVSVPWYALSLIAWAIVAVLGVRDLGVSEKVLVVLVVAETLLVLVYSVVIMFTDGFAFSAAPLQPSNLWAPGAGALVVIAATAFAGVEQGAVYIEESKNPRRTVPLATYGTIILIAVVYFFASWVQISAGGPQIFERAGAEGPDLFFNQAAVTLGSTALHLGHVLFLTSIVAAMTAFHNSGARYTFALGRENVLPRKFGETSAQHAPRNASIAQSVVGLVAIFTWALAGWDPLVQMFFWAGNTGALGIVLLITLTNFAVIGYFARNNHGESAWHRIGAPALAAVLLLTLSYLALTNLSTLYGVEPGTGPAVLVPIAYLIILAGGIIWGQVLKNSRPAVYAGIGLGASSAAAGSSGLSALLDDPADTNDTTGNFR